MSAECGPSQTLLAAVRVLHGRGAHRIRVEPYFYATGHWRCSLFVDAAPEGSLGYSSSLEWKLPGRVDNTPIDPEGAADAIWAALPEEQRAAALRPDPGYALWWAKLLELCGTQNVPYLFSDYANPQGNGFVGISRSELQHPLPPAPPRR